MKSLNRSCGVRRSSFRALAQVMLLSLMVVPSIASAEPEVAKTPALSTLDALVQEALAQSPDDHVGAKTLAGAGQGSGPSCDAARSNGGPAASPQPFSGYESSDFYYTGFGVSQDIPGPGKLGLRAKQADEEAEAARDAFLVQQRQVAEQVRETYFNLFYLGKILDLLRETQANLDRIAATTS